MKYDQILIIMFQIERFRIAKNRSYTINSKYTFAVFNSVEYFITRLGFQLAHENSNHF